MPRRMKIELFILACLSLCLGACSDRGAATQESSTDLVKRVQQLEQQLGVQQDIEDIRRLQYIYNYYNSNGFQKQLLDLIAEDAESIEIGGQGVYHGKEGFKRNFGRYHEDGETLDRAREFGRALVQLAGMGVITVAPDRKAAEARVRVITPVLAGFPNTTFKMNTGDYEMKYVKEGGQWKISKFKYVHIFAAQFNKDGSITPGYSTRPDGSEDAPTTWYHPWPEAGTLPFHFVNPVSGETAPELLNPQRYWIGNWEGEFGKGGHRDVVKARQP